MAFQPHFLYQPPESLPLFSLFLGFAGGSQRHNSGMFKALRNTETANPFPECEREGGGERVVSVHRTHAAFSMQGLASIFQSAGNFLNKKDFSQLSTLFAKKFSL